MFSRPARVCGGPGGGSEWAGVNGVGGPGWVGVKVCEAGRCGGCGGACGSCPVECDGAGHDDVRKWPAGLVVGKGCVKCVCQPPDRPFGVPERPFVVCSRSVCR